MAESSASATRNLATLHGCRIPVRYSGSGAPLLFLHEEGGAGVWHPCLDELARNFRVIVPEHPGFGDSDTPEWLDHIHDLAFFYLDLLRAEALTRVHVVGCALGGWIAAEMAMFDSSRLHTLTLVGAAGMRVPGVPRADVFMWPAETTARAMFHDPGLAEVAAQRAVDPALADAHIKNRYMTARLAWQPRFFDPLLMKWLRRVDLPSLIVWGAEDRILPPEHALAFKESLSRSELAMIPECGHLPHVEKKDEFVARLISFIEGAEQ